MFLVWAWGRFRGCLHACSRPCLFVQAGSDTAEILYSDIEARESRILDRSDVQIGSTQFFFFQENQRKTVVYAFHDLHRPLIGTISLATD